MTRVNTNLPALWAAEYLNRNSEALSRSLERLSSGSRINRSADDPAGWVVAELLRSEGRGLRQAIENSQRTANVLGTAEAALNEVSAILITMRELVTSGTQEGVLTDEEIDAIQLQLDSSIETINRIADTTSFGGEHLLNGSYAYVTASVDPSDMAQLDIYRAAVGASGLTVSVSVASAAERAVLYYSGVGVSTDQDIRITGSDGTAVVSLAAGTSNSAVVEGVNSFSDRTGVRAVLLAGGSVAFESMSMGSQEFVSVEDVDGTADFVVADAGGTPTSRDYGKDLVADINGERAYGRGTRLILNTTFLDMELTLTEGLNSSIALGVESGTEFAITGGGAVFQIGPGNGVGDQVRVGLPDVSAGNLGGASGSVSELMGGEVGSLRSDPQRAMRIIEEAILDVASIRGRLGALESNVVQANVDSLSIAAENVASAESVIRDTDFARETAEMVRRQILVSAGVSILASANAIPEAVLALLR